MSLINIIDFKSLGDSRGNLVSLEATQNIPFEIKRIYYLFNTDIETRRGYHAHKELKQIAIALHGSCRLLLDDGKEKEEVLLNKPTQGLLIESFVWREIFDFSDDCVLLVIADSFYDEEDYIRDYNVFLKIVEKKNEKNNFRKI